MACFRALLLGVKDGWDLPWDLTCGMTWEDQPQLNDAYDTGANFGQWLGRLVKRGQPTARPAGRRYASLIVWA